jgi:type IV pilus assembly protein PilN
MIKINLLPVRAARKKEAIRQQLSVAGLSFLMLFVIFGGIYWSKNSKISKARTDIRQGENELKELKRKVGELSRIKEQKRIAQEKLGIVKQLEANRSGPVKLLHDISNAIPEKAWIEILKETKNVITLKGFASTEDVVADFMRGLERYPEMGRVELEIVRKAKKENVELIGFTIKLIREQKPKT